MMFKGEAPVQTIVSAHFFVLISQKWSVTWSFELPVDFQYVNTGCNYHLITCFNLKLAVKR